MRDGTGCTDVACPECLSDNVEVRGYDFGICRQTGYHDAGERFRCRDCGATGDAAYLVRRVRLGPRVGHPANPQPDLATGAYGARTGGNRARRGHSRIDFRDLKPKARPRLEMLRSLPSYISLHRLSLQVVTPPSIHSASGQFGLS